VGADNRLATDKLGHRDAAREATKACEEVAGGVPVSALLRAADQPEIRRPSLRSLRQDVGLTMSPPSESKQPPKPQPKPPKPKPVKETYRGFLPDDDAIYQDGGFLWCFIMGTYLNPHIKPKKKKGPR
jgi:hypothetical protein